MTKECKDWDYVKSWHCKPLLIVQLWNPRQLEDIPKTRPYPNIRVVIWTIWWKCCPLEAGSRYHKFTWLDSKRAARVQSVYEEGDAKECVDRDVQSQPNHWSNTTTAGTSMSLSSSDSWSVRRKENWMATHVSTIICVQDFAITLVVL